MTDTYRALCSELVHEWDTAHGDHDLLGVADVMDRARAALAEPEPVAPPMPMPGDAEGLAEVFWGRYDQPEPVAPTDEELLSMRSWSCHGPTFDSDLVDFARAVLARWGTPAIQPVPPEPGVADHVTDDEGTRWDRTTDAALWAKAFCLICPEMASREDVMIGWFANAIMAGCDHQAWKMDAELKPVPVSERRPGPEDCDADGFCWFWDYGWTRQQRGWHEDGFCWFWDYGWTRQQRGWHEDECTHWLPHWLPHWALPVPAIAAELEGAGAWCVRQV